jgi:hypothetical protein
MKRSWMGFVLLVLLLSGSLLVTRQMVRIHDPIGEDLREAARCALEEDWDRADAFFRKAEDSWERWEHFRGCVADHNPVEEIDGDFEILKVFCHTRDRVAFAGGCRELARKVTAVGEAHQLVWWNLL